MIETSIYETIPPVRFFSGKRYVAWFSGYTEKEVKKTIKNMVKQCRCAKGDVKKVRDVDGRYTIYYNPKKVSLRAVGV